MPILSSDYATVLGHGTVPRRATPEDAARSANADVDTRDVLGDIGFRKSIGGGGHGNDYAYSPVTPPRDLGRRVWYGIAAREAVYRKVAEAEGAIRSPLALEHRETLRSVVEMVKGHFTPNELRNARGAATLERAMNDELPAELSVAAKKADKAAMAFAWSVTRAASKVSDAEAFQVALGQVGAKFDALKAARETEKNALPLTRSQPSSTTAAADSLHTVNFQSLPEIKRVCDATGVRFPGSVAGLQGLFREAGRPEAATHFGNMSPAAARLMNGVIARLGAR